MTPLTIRSGLILLIARIRTGLEQGDSALRGISQCLCLSRVLEKFEQTGQLSGEELRDAGIEFTI